MHKAIKGLLAGGMIVALLATIGCSGDEKKKEPAPQNNTKQTATTQKQGTNPEAKKTVVKPVPKSSLYRYGVHLNDVDKLPPMTDEVIQQFEKHAKTITIAEKDPQKGRNGIWTFTSSPQSRSSSAQIWTYHFIAELPGHYDSEFVNSQGKKTKEQHFAHIEMTADKKSDKLRNIRVYTYDLTKEMDTKGKTTEVYKETFK